MRRGPIDGVSFREVVRHADGRGSFAELIRASDPSFAAGFGQLSWASRAEGTVTAWHIHPRQWDWWFVPRGALRVVLHDLRETSPTFGNTVEEHLGPSVGERIVAIPPGVAHGYKVTKGPAEIIYVTSHEYRTDHPAPPIGEEGRLPPDDPAIGYDWTR